MIASAGFSHCAPIHEQHARLTQAQRRPGLDSGQARNNVESTRGDIQLCQRRRAKHAQGCGRGSPYLAWVVFYPTGGSDLPERPGSRSAVRQLRMVMLSGWRASQGGPLAWGKPETRFISLII